MKKKKRGNHPIQEILRHRRVNDELQYLLKWKDQNREYGCWEPAGNVDRPELIQQYEEVRARRLQQRKEALKKMRIGFTRRFDPEELFGTTNYLGHLFYLTKWADTKITDCAPSAKGNNKCPQTVIKLYENTEPEEDDKKPTMDTCLQES